MAEKFSRKDLAAALKAEGVVPSAAAGLQTIEAVLGLIQKALLDGKEVDISGFGKFTVKESAAREGKNPKTGEKITIAARKSPAFKAAKAFKDAVANG